MDKINKAIFLDRDGIINKEKKDYVKTVDELEIFPNIHNSIKKLKENGFMIVVITNQSAINRGFSTHEKIKKIHDKIQNYLISHGVSIDAFYYCPHRPDENCECRKPKPGLLTKAVNELSIDPAKSWIIGNNDSDVIAGESVGCKAIKISDPKELESAVNEILITIN